MNVALDTIVVIRLTADEAVELYREHIGLANGPATGMMLDQLAELDLILDYIET